MTRQLAVCVVAFLAIPLASCQRLTPPAPSVDASPAAAGEGHGTKELKPSLPARTTDPAQLDPPIKEPAYQTKNPRYCLLAFGSAKEIRAWLVVDGKAVYLDHNGNGDLTEQEDRLAEPGADFRPVPLTVAGKGTHYEVTKVHLSKRGEEEVVFVGASTRGKFRQYGDAILADRPQIAPLLHFDGPLTMFLQRKLLLRGERPLQLHAGVATVTREGSAGVFVEYDPAIPDGISPVAEIEFPGKGGQFKPIVIKLQLRQRC